MNTDEWRSQLKRGILEYSILLLMNSREYYGYELISEISQWKIIAAKESTVYPLLRRLQKENYLECYWKESVEGLPPRKYYRMTEKGREYLDLMKEEWKNLIQVIDHLSERECELDG